MHTSMMTDRQPQRKIHLIGISGKIGSGKTTLAQEFLRVWPDFERASFAGALRVVMGTLLKLPVSQMQTQEQKNTVHEDCNDKTLGELLQMYGDGMRQIETDVWVRALFKCFDAEQSFWIIDDLRYPNEADRIKRAGGILIRLDGDPGNKAKESKRDLNAPSETALDNYTGFDYRINTDAYKDNLGCMFDTLLAQLDRHFVLQQK